MMGSMDGPNRGELGEWATKIEQLGRHTDALTRLGKEIKKRDAKVTVVIGKIEEEVEAGQALARATGEAIKERLSDRGLDNSDRARVEKLAAQFENAGTKFSDISHQVLEQGRAANQAGGGDVRGGGGGG
ncbi:hypothetical protein T484DRAFT_1897590, partial [Baffinella frigidus]